MCSPWFLKLQEKLASSGNNKSCNYVNMGVQINIATQNIANKADAFICPPQNLVTKETSIYSILKSLKFTTVHLN